MINFIIGLVIGGCLAALILSLCMGANDEDIYISYPDDDIYICYPDYEKCCKFCPGAFECKYACKRNPNSCGQVVKIKGDIK